MKLLRGARRVQTFHGVAGKYRTVYDSPSESMRSWDRLFFINERRLRHFIECGAIDEDSQAARLIGMPKLDCLVDGSLQRDELLVNGNRSGSTNDSLRADVVGTFVRR